MSKDNKISGVKRLQGILGHLVVGPNSHLPVSSPTATTADSKLDAQPKGNFGIADEKEVTIPQASLDSLGHLSFEQVGDFNKSLQLGVFFLKFPPRVSKLIEHGDKFVGQFHNNKKIQKDAENIVENLNKEAEKIGVNLSYATGYRDPIGNQVRQLAVAKDYWQEILEDKSLVELVEEMNQLAITVLKNVLDHFKIPKEDWNELTGGLTTDKGMHRMLFNNYDKGKVGENGLAAHTDFGWITILRATDPGLRVAIEPWFALSEFTPKEIDNLKKWVSQDQSFTRFQAITSENEDYKRLAFTAKEILALEAKLGTAGGEEAKNIIAKLKANEKWIDVDPTHKKDYFIVNFGDCLNDLTKHMDIPVTACTHWVPKLDSQHNGRKSFAIFTENQHNEAIYTLHLRGKDKEGNPIYEKSKLHQNSHQKIKERLHRLYDKGGKGVTTTVSPSAISISTTGANVSQNQQSFLVSFPSQSGKSGSLVPENPSPLPSSRL